MTVKEGGVLAMCGDVGQGSSQVENPGRGAVFRNTGTGKRKTIARVKESMSLGWE